MYVIKIRKTKLININSQLSKYKERVCHFIYYYNVVVIYVLK